MSLCSVDHVVPGRHLDGCPVDGCSGCWPALALDGLQVCGWHARRTRWAIAQAPDVVGHLREHVEPGSATGDRVGGSRTPPEPLSLDAVAAADDLHAALASWVLLVLEEHPDRLDGPGWQGSAVRPASKRRVLGEVVYQASRVVGLRGDTAGDTAPTRRLATWLLRHLDWALAQPWALELATEMPEQISRLHAAWPTSEHATRLGLPCPGCGLLTLVRWAPRWQGAPVTIACERIACAAVVPEEKYPWLARLATDLHTA